MLMRMIILFYSKILNIHLKCYPALYYHESIMLKFKHLVSLNIAIALTISACSANSSSVNDISDNPNNQATVAQESLSQETSKTLNKDETAKSSPSTLALSNDGIITVNPETGSTKNFTFDSDVEITKTVVTNILGEPKETVENSECPAGKLTMTTWPNGFTINVAENKFVGWGIRPQTEDTKLTTMNNISVGSTVKELKESYDVSFFESSLGIEFNIDKMSGIVSKNAPDGVITNLWAGTNCIFR